MQIRQVVEQELAPVSLALSTSASEGLPHDTMLYFNLVTPTTLGYGDVTPVVDAVRSLVIVDGTDRKIPRFRKSNFSEPIVPDGYEAIVVSMCRAVAALSLEIAEAIRDPSAR